MTLLPKSQQRFCASKPRRGARGVGVALWLSAAGAAAACSIDLAPLAKPDAATAASDAGADACLGCLDSSVADGCPAGTSPFGFGRCCPVELSVEFDDASVAGVLIHGEHAVVYGSRASRPWVARVDRCDGSVITQSSDAIAIPGQFRGAALSGDTLVLGGSYDESSRTRWMAAWGNAATLSGFSTYLATTSTNSIASAVAMATDDEAWLAGTHRYEQNEQRALLIGLDLNTSAQCLQYPKGWFGGGAGLTAGKVLAASRDGYNLRVTSYALATCSPAACGCDTASSNAVDLDQRYLVTLRASAVRDGDLYAVGASFKQYFPVAEQGAYVARIKPDLSLDAFQVWGSSGSSLDDARALDFGADGRLVVGVARACDFTDFELGQCSLGAVFGLPAGFDANSTVTFETMLADLNEVTGVRFEPEASAGILVVGNRLPASPGAPTVGVLRRCSQAGACP